MVKYRISVTLNKRTRYQYETFNNDQEAYDYWYESRTKEDHGGQIIFEKVDPKTFKILTGKEAKVYK